MKQFDAIVVGAGFSGLFLLHKLREIGMTACVIEAGDDVGGTWYWNRYPGARCDIESIEYSYSFSPELEQEWQWSERYASQPEILSYLQHVAERFDLRRDISFGTRVTAATWDEQSQIWIVETDDGQTRSAQFCIMGTGCLSSPNTPDIPGLADFSGGLYLTSLWPHDGVDFTGRKVAVIGTGSSAVQSIPRIATQAESLTVFQRTPNFIVPAQNRPLDKHSLVEIKARYRELRESERHSVGGMALGTPPSKRAALATPPEEFRAEMDERWEFGGLGGFLNSHPDAAFDAAAAERLGEYVCDKIREIVEDPHVAGLLCPDTYPFGSKRLCVDTGYFQAFNRANVVLVDLNAAPIVRISAHAIETENDCFAVDAIVLATGFDAMTGALSKIDIRGSGGLRLADKWRSGPQTYLGLMSAGFPNLFLVTGPGSPSVLSNMVVSIEQHGDWIAALLQKMRQDGKSLVEPALESEKTWSAFVQGVAEPTIFMQSDSWYLGANIPGKPRVFMPFVAGVGTYRRICDAVADSDYAGFTIDDAESGQLPEFYGFLSASG